MRFIGFGFGFTLLALTNCYDESCYVPRAAFDVGSASTKARYAIVNTCAHKIEKVLVDEQVKVRYKGDLSRKNREQFTPEIQKQGLDALRKLKGMIEAKSQELSTQTGKDMKPKKWVGVATSAFRTAKNGKDVAVNLSQDTGIELAVIGQEKEAELGFLSGAVNVKDSLDKIVVWDIGGGSMQITALAGPIPEKTKEEGLLTKETKFDVFKGNLASESMKYFILEKIQNKKISEVKSPNPMPFSELVAAKEHAKVQSNEVSEALKQRIVAPKTTVVGIGGVWGKSITRMTKETESITRKQLEEALAANANKSDADIGGEFANTDVSNIALVLGYMEGLGVDKVKIVDANLTDGILVSPSFW